MLEYTGRIIQLAFKNHPNMGTGHRKHLDYLRRHQLLKSTFQHSLGQLEFSAFRRQVIARTESLLANPEPQLEGLVDHIRHRFGANFNDHWRCLLERLALREAQE